MAHNNLGLVYISKGDIRKALDHYRETLKTKPNDCVAHTNLGNIYRNQGLWKKPKHPMKPVFSPTHIPDSPIAISALCMFIQATGDMHRHFLKKPRPWIPWPTTPI